MTVPSTHHSLTHSLIHISPVLTHPTGIPHHPPVPSAPCPVSQVGLCAAVHGDAPQVLPAAPLMGCPTLPCPWGQQSCLYSPWETAQVLAGSPAPTEPLAPPLSTEAPSSSLLILTGKHNLPGKNPASASCTLIPPCPARKSLQITSVRLAAPLL